MKMIHDAVDMPLKEMREALALSMEREEMQLMKQGRAMPNKTGNRKQRRAAEALARKREHA